MGRPRDSVTRTTEVEAAQLKFFERNGNCQHAISYFGTLCSRSWLPESRTLQRLLTRLWQRGPSRCRPRLARLRCHMAAVGLVACAAWAHVIPCHSVSCSMLKVSGSRQVTAPRGMNRWTPSLQSSVHEGMQVHGMGFKSEVLASPPAKKEMRRTLISLYRYLPHPI